MSNKLENSEGSKEKFVADIENNPEIDAEEINIKIEEELNNLEKNGAELVDTVDSIGGEEKLKEMLENNKEKGGNIFKQVRNIALIFGAISAIPMVYSVIKPEVFNKLVEAAGNYPSIALGSIGAMGVIYLIVDEIRSGGFIKGIKEFCADVKKNFISKDEISKDERHERFIERNF